MFNCSVKFFLRLILGCNVVIHVLPYTEVVIEHMLKEPRRKNFMKIKKWLLDLKSFLIRLSGYKKLEPIKVKVGNRNYINGK